jgi:hypothetical protein
MSKYVKRSIVFQDVTRDDVNKIVGFQSNYPLIITGLVSLFQVCLSPIYENFYLQDGTKISEWIQSIWGNEIEKEQIHFAKIRMNMMFQKYETNDLDRLEWMLHAHLNEFGIYRIWNGIYDFVTIHDHQFFMKFLIVLSTHRRLEKNKIIEMGTEYFQYLDSQGENRISSKIPNHFYPFVKKDEISMNIFFQNHIPLSVEIENELQDVFDHPSPYMWDIHCMMRENIIVTPSPRGFVTISPVPFCIDHDDKTIPYWDGVLLSGSPFGLPKKAEEEEKIELDEKEIEKVVEIENIVKEMIGYIMILYRDEIIREKVNAKIQEWKENKIQNVRIYMDMNVRNEIIQKVLEVVS